MAGGAVPVRRRRAVGDIRQAQAGETELLRRFLRSKRCIYFLASRTSLHDNVESLKKKIAELTGKRLYERLQVRGLGELLTYLAEEVERPCLVIDEFGYLVELDRGVLSDLQAAWDEVLSRRSFFLVLCVSMFETEVLG